jgi:ornithine cyclodeaminase/alanine dehydrogenase-like protein (mu-crystallin family)
MTRSNTEASILYLSNADIEACALSPVEITDAVEAAFAEAAFGSAETRGGLAIPVDGLANFQAKGGVLRKASYGAVKWFGYFPGNTEQALPQYRPLMILNEALHGFPIAIMSAEWITAQRTAAISAIGAKRLARIQSSRIGFVGCGAQARANLDALMPHFEVTSVLACSRRLESAEAFANFCRERGVAAEVTDDPRRTVAEADIVISSVPRTVTGKPFLDANWVSPGTFVSMVDVGQSWKRESLGAFTDCFTDEMSQGLHRAEEGGVGELEKSLIDVVGGAHPGRTSPDARIALIFSGTGLADVAAGAVVYERALALGLGQQLPA